MAGRELIPQATVEEIVAHRNNALRLYGEAFTAIEAADAAIKEAHAEAARAAGNVRPYIDGRHNEVDAFHKAVHKRQYRHSSGKQRRNKIL